MTREKIEELISWYELEQGFSFSKKERSRLEIELAQLLAFLEQLDQGNSIFLD